jgi:hypothetical protein
MKRYLPFSALLDILELLQCLQCLIIGVRDSRHETLSEDVADLANGGARGTEKAVGLEI